MDYNLAFSAIGYGAMRVLRERDYSATPFALPANRILRKPDPVQFCIEALGAEHPDWAAKIDEETRRAIHARLSKEARRGCQAAH
jgi:hypothetical protein